METLGALKTKNVYGVPVIAIVAVVCVTLSLGLVFLSKKRGGGGVSSMLDALKRNPMKMFEGMSCGKKKEGLMPKPTGPPPSSPRGGSEDEEEERGSPEGLLPPQPPGQEKEDNFFAGATL